MRDIILSILILVFCSIPLAGVSFAQASLEREVQKNPAQEDDPFDDFAFDTALQVYDPLEPVNRVIFSFNDTLINYVGHPLSSAYEFVTPKFFRTGIRNVFHNGLFPVRFVNNLLQGKGYAAGVEMSRFIFNTTAGIGGLFDVASSLKPKYPSDTEDLGQTFGTWGIGEGFYLVLPVLGPSTARDSVGLVGDIFMDPITYLKPRSLSLGLTAGRSFNELGDILDTYDSLKKTSIDPYSAFRDAYVQHRRSKVKK